MNIMARSILTSLITLTIRIAAQGKVCWNKCAKKDAKKWQVAGGTIIIAVGGILAIASWLDLIN
jgi:hypothetical protein